MILTSRACAGLRDREASLQFHRISEDYKEIMIALRPIDTTKQGPAGAPGPHLARHFRRSSLRAGRHAALARRLGVPRPHGSGERLGQLSRLGRHDPELLAERLRPPFQREQPRSDKLLMAAFMPLSWFGLVPLMAFDKRSGWSSLPPALNVVGFVLLCLGLRLSWQVLKEKTLPRRW